MRIFSIFAIVVLFLLTSCATLQDYTLTKRSAIDKEIVAARVETESRLKALNDQQLSLLQQVVTAHETREQGASDFLFKGLATSNTLKTPTRPEMVMGQSIQQTATQLPPATTVAQAKAFQDLKTELDEARVSADALKAQYEKELGQARAEGAAKEAVVKDLNAKIVEVDKERVAVITKAGKTEAELSDKRKEVDNAIIAAKTKEVDDAKSTAAIKTKMSMVLGALSLLCIVGTIYSPIMKTKLGIGSVVFGFLSIGVWYVTGFVVAVVGAVCLLGLVAWALRSHWIESKTSTNLIRAVQQVKTTAKADYDRVLAPALAEWNSVYSKDGTTVPDKAVEAHIDQRLMEVGDK